MGSSIAIADQGTPIGEFNRVLGLGIDEPVSSAELEQAMAWMHQHASPRFSLQIAQTARPAETIQRWIQARALKPSGNGIAKYYRYALPAEDHPMPTALEVKLVEPQLAADFGHVVQAGFGLPEAVIPWFSALVGRPKWQVYVAYDNQIPVASGAMFIDHNWAWFGIDATLPDYRGRGAQNALIKQRLTDGISAGVVGFTAETGQPSAGEEGANKSYGNYHRAGFERLYIRPSYVTNK
ncbi:GNAT family N-acetyltransferase [Paenibacillus sp. BC26]|uniref:GNAT family N-acetyltransferase n=1 Tax=Paenibacillus sp. BC26 TaxID=1881032 RepID=UPI001160BFEF|nr:GNAT family N-acetyltransferase [Paenibacillus sp. BC26]